MQLHRGGVRGLQRASKFTAFAASAVLLLQAAGLAGAGVAGPPSTPAEPLNAFVTAFNAQDAGRAAAPFAAEAELMLPDAPPARTRAAVTTTLEAYLRSVRILDLVTVNVSHSGTLAIASGRLTLTTKTANHGADARSGSYLAAFRRTKTEIGRAHV